MADKLDFSFIFAEQLKLNMARQILTELEEWKKAKKILDSKPDREKNNNLKLSRKEYGLKHSYLYVDDMLVRMDTHQYLGKGGFGKVKAVQTEDGTRFALKIEDGDNLVSDPNALNDKNIELEIMSILGSLRGHMLRKSNKPKLDKTIRIMIQNKFYTLQTLHGGANLYEGYINPNNNYKKITLNNKQNAQVALLAMLDIQRLHNKGIIHGDVKASNFMCDINGNTIVISSIDFGTSILIDPNILPRTFVVGVLPISTTELYAAPELNNLSFHVSSTAQDVYALGIMLKYCLDLSEDVFPFIKEMLNPEWNERISLKEAIIQCSEIIKNLLSTDTKTAIDSLFKETEQVESKAKSYFEGIKQQVEQLLDINHQITLEERKTLLAFVCNVTADSTTLLKVVGKIHNYYSKNNIQNIFNTDVAIINTIAAHPSSTLDVLSNIHTFSCGFDDILIQHPRIDNQLFSNIVKKTSDKDLYATAIKHPKLLPLVIKHAYGLDSMPKRAWGLSNEFTFNFDYSFTKDINSVIKLVKTDKALLCNILEQIFKTYECDDHSICNVSTIIDIIDKVDIPASGLLKLQIVLNELIQKKESIKTDLFNKKDDLKKISLSVQKKLSVVFFEAFFKSLTTEGQYAVTKQYATSSDNHAFIAAILEVHYGSDFDEKGIVWWQKRKLAETYHNNRAATEADLFNMDQPFLLRLFKMSKIPATPENIKYWLPQIKVDNREAIAKQFYDINLVNINMAKPIIFSAPPIVAPKDPDFEAFFNSLMTEGNDVVTKKYAGNDDDYVFIEEVLNTHYNGVRRFSKDDINFWKELHIGGGNRAATEAKAFECRMLDYPECFIQRLFVRLNITPTEVNINEWLPKVTRDNHKAIAKQLYDKSLKVNLKLVL